MHMTMKRKLLLALLTVSLLIVAAVPAYADSEDPLRPVDPEGLLLQESDIDGHSGLRLYSVANEIYDLTLTKNSDGADTYTLDIRCKDDTTINLYNYRDWYNEWKDKITRVIINDGAVEISDYGFYNFSRLISVTLPASLKKIRKAAFYGCICLYDIDISNVTSIGTSAFCNCGPNAFKFNYRSSITDGKKALACSSAIYDQVCPDAPEGTTATSQYTEVHETIKQFLSEMDLDDKSEIYKVKAIYKWITENVVYDYDALESGPDNPSHKYAGTVHSALFTHKAVCQGYATLLKTMLNEAGVDCLYITGGTHGWNMIRIDGIWYLADSTWDAPSTKFPEFKSSGLPALPYFLRSAAFFYSDEGKHKPPESTNDVFDSLYPVSAEDYYKKISKNGFTFSIIEGKATLLKYTGNASSLTLPDKVVHNGTSYPVTKIGEYAFDSLDPLKTVIIPSGYTHIGTDAFIGCWNLSTITLPSTLVQIDEDAFSSVTALKNIKFTGTSDQFKKILIKEGNYMLCDRTVHCKDKDFADPRSFSRASIKISPKSFEYNGKNQFPAITVTLKNGTVLKRDRDYILLTHEFEKLYPTSKVSVNFIDIIGKGDYARFMTTVQYRINPLHNKLKKLKRGKKCLTAYWTKQTKYVSGYQVQYALNKKFTKKVKTVKVRGAKNGSVKIKKLKSKKKYYVRVRTYKYIDNEYTQESVYSSWSNVKSVKVK